VRGLYIPNLGYFKSDLLSLRTEAIAAIQSGG
jgi:hypothetical protein